MTLSDLKIYFRNVIKVLSNGPPVGTPGNNRAAGVLDALDKLAEETQPAVLLTKIDVAASAAAGVHISVVNNLLVFGLNGTTPPTTPVITPGTTVPTPAITVLTTTAY